MRAVCVPSGRGENVKTARPVSLCSRVGALVVQSCCECAVHGVVGMDRGRARGCWRHEAPERNPQSRFFRCEGCMTVSVGATGLPCLRQRRCHKRVYGASGPGELQRAIQTRLDVGYIT